MEAWDNVSELSLNMKDIQNQNTTSPHVQCFGWKAFALKILWKKYTPDVKFHLGQTVLFC